MTKRPGATSDNGFIFKKVKEKAHYLNKLKLKYKREKNPVGGF